MKILKLAALIASLAVALGATAPAEAAMMHRHHGMMHRPTMHHMMRHHRMMRHRMMHHRMMHRM